LQLYRQKQTVRFLCIAMLCKAAFTPDSTPQRKTTRDAARVAYCKRMLIYDKRMQENGQR